MNNNDKYLSVSALTRYLKYKFDSDEHLKCVFLKGEISNFKSHSSGHLYFSVKDEGSKINAIMFSMNAKKLNFVPVEGSKVLLVGRVSVYESTGNYQIYVDEMLEDGVGNLYVAYEKLKNDLQKEGLFDESHKKPLPKYPKRIGVVTASTGAAIKDIISTIKRRYPICEIIVFPSLVQGEAAASDIVKNIEKAEYYDLDTLIVGRGGGSIEDLWPFNEEIVARAIYRCSIPTISAVGHEIDFTIADFVADHRAPTPTGAAEMAVPNKLDVLNYIDQLRIRNTKVVRNKIDLLNQKLNDITSKYILQKPMSIFEVKEQQYDNLLEKVKHNMINIYNQKEKKYSNIMTSIVFKDSTKLLDVKKNKYLQIISKLETLSPFATIQRGYAIAKKDDKVVKSIKDVKSKDVLSLNLSDGNIDVEVI